MTPPVNGFVTEARARLDREFKEPSRKGWTKQTLQQLGIGLDSDGRFVIETTNPDGVPCGVLRYSDNGTEPKMDAQTGSIRELWPAPETIDGGTVYVVEGEPDVVSMVELGYTSSVAVPGTGTIRSAEAEDWPHRLAVGRDKVIFIPDCDRDGRKSFRELAERTAAFVDSYLLDLDLARDDKYDVGDLLCDFGKEQGPRILDSSIQHGERVVPVPKLKPGEARAVLTRASETRPKKVRWLIRHLVPLGGQTVIAGEPGLGKSTLTALLAAKVTTGQTGGDLPGPQDVLIYSAEDAWDQVILPRLIAHGADLTKVHRLKIEDQDGERPLTLPDDISLIEDACEKLKQEGTPVALLIVDPISAALCSKTDSHNDASVRRALAPLASFSERTEIAVIVVAHLNKAEGVKILSRLGGSVAFGAFARSVAALGRNPDDPEGEAGCERVLVHIKSNWGRYATSQSFRLESKDVELPDGTFADVGYFRELGDCEINVADLQATRNDDDHVGAEESICAALEKGPLPSREVKATVKAEIGCSIRTVERAAKRLRDRGELTISTVTGNGFSRSTTWQLSVATAPIQPSVVTGQTNVLEPNTSETTHTLSESVATGGVVTEQTSILKPNTGGFNSQSRHNPNGGVTDNDLLARAERLASRAALATRDREGTQ